MLPSDQTKTQSIKLAIYLWKLSFWNTISIENDSGWFEPSRFIELDEKLTHHIRQVLNDLLSRALYSHCGTVSARMSIHAAYHLCSFKSHFISA